MNEPITEELQQVAVLLTSIRENEALLKQTRLQLMIKAHEGGMTYQAIGDALGVTKAYVHQQISKMNTRLRNLENAEIAGETWPVTEVLGG